MRGTDASYRVSGQQAQEKPAKLVGYSHFLCDPLSIAWEGEKGTFSIPPTKQARHPSLLGAPAADRASEGDFVVRARLCTAWGMSSRPRDLKWRLLSGASIPGKW